MKILFKMKHHSINFENNWQVYLFEEYVSHYQGKLHQQLQPNFTVGFHWGEKSVEKSSMLFFFLILSDLDFGNPFKTLWYSENHVIPVFIVLPFIQKAYLLKNY